MGSQGRAIERALETLETMLDVCHCPMATCDVTVLNQILTKATP